MIPPADRTRATIPLTIPSIDEEDVRAVAEVLRTGQLVQGSRVAEFESAVADYVGTREAVAVANCTAALHLSLLAVGVQPGDRVAVPTYSWPATANVVVLCGAIPVFVDVDPTTFNMDPIALEAVIERERVAAVVPVHAFGGMANMPRILELAARAGVRVVEDAACALGADLGGRRAGAWGNVGCFSFHPRKAITTGEGGIVTTDDPDLARRIRVMRNHGLDPESPTPEFIAAGYNLRLTEFQAALGSSQMGKLDRIVDARRAGAERYDRLLEGTDIGTPKALDGSRHVYQSYVILLPPDYTGSRAELIDRLADEGVQATIGTYHIPRTQYFRERLGGEASAFPNTDDIASRAVTLPLYEHLEEDQQLRVVEGLRRAL